jgi:hypothetical protein
MLVVAVPGLPGHGGHMTETTAASTRVPVSIQLIGGLPSCRRSVACGCRPIGGTAGVGKTALASGATRHPAAQP